VPLSLCT